MGTITRFIYFLSVVCMPWYALAQESDNIVSVKAKGTGQTTGHIATLTVKNNTDKPITTVPQTCFIPSDGKYQSYIGRIPGGITIGPGQQVDIPVSGFCADVHKPPVSSGEDMPPIDEWIPVAHNHVEPPDPVNPGMLSQGEPAEPFEESAIPDIINSPGFNPGVISESPIQPVWPGTGEPTGGTLDPSADPRTFAPIAVAALKEIEEAVVIVQADQENATPYSSNPARERESIIQQTFWITMGALTGEPYEKDDFAEVTYTQYQDQTGTPVSRLPEEDQEKLNVGIDQFWTTFMATGIEAKVLDLGDEGTVLIGYNKCKCDSMHVKFALTRGDTTHTGIFRTNFEEEILLPYYEGYFYPRPGDEIILTITEMKLFCSCSNAEKTESHCDKIFREKSSVENSEGGISTTIKGEGEFSTKWGANHNIRLSKVDDKEKDDDEDDDNQSVLLKFWDENTRVWQDTYQKFEIAAWCTDSLCGGVTRNPEAAHAKHCRRTFKLSFLQL